MEDSEKTKVLNWFRTRCLDAECPMCGAPLRTASGEPNMGLYHKRVLLEVVSKTDTGVKKDNKGKVGVCLECNNCGYMMLFDAQKIGIN